MTEPRDSRRPEDQLSFGELESAPEVGETIFDEDDVPDEQVQDDAKAGPSDPPATGKSEKDDAASRFELVEPDPPLAPPKPDPVAEAFARARALDDGNDIHGAIAGYREVIAQDATHIRARNNLALLLGRTDAEAALLELERALSIDPDNVTLLCNRASLLMSKLRYEAAEVDLKRATRFDPDSAEVLTLLGVLFCRRARWRDAVDPLRRATEIESQRAEAHYYLGEAYNHIDQLPAALAAYETAAALSPANWRALKGIGIILDRMRRPAEAAIAYQKAREAHHR